MNATAPTMVDGHGPRKRQARLRHDALGGWQQDARLSVVEQRNAVNLPVADGAWQVSPVGAMFLTGEVFP